MFLLKKIAVMALGLILLGLMISSCAPETNGPIPELKKPVVKIVNIPASGSHFTNSPTINWYGTDVDGYIIAYEYAVIAASVVAAAIDTTDDAEIRSYAEANIERPGPTANCNPACWTIVDVEKSDSPTRQEIRLIAGTSPADTVVQFFFVRAVDNDSVTSEIEYSIYSRNNNPPDTDILTKYEKNRYFDLPDTGVAYKGIAFEWKGSDKIDFPNDTDQPVFDFYYQVFGPYPISSLNVDTETGELLEGSSIDTTDISKLVLTSRDTTRGGVWVLGTTTKVFNLWRNAPDSDTTRENYFVIKVSARDDASAPDPTPEFRAFRVIYPKFEKPILLFTPRNCLTRSGEISCGKRTDGIEIYSIDDVLDYYRRIFVTAGYNDIDVISTAPDKLTTAKYKLIVMMGDGDNPTFVHAAAQDDYANLPEYLNFGGNVWVWALAPFYGWTKGNDEGLKGYDANSFPYRYFRVLGEYREGWRLRYQTRARWSGPLETMPENSDQFIGGLALNGSGFEDFSVDLPKVQMTYNFIRNGTKFNELVTFRGAPNTNYLVRDVLAQPLFLYRATFEGNTPDSLKPWLADLHGTVLAVRHSNTTFKTAVFAFSPWCIYEDQAVTLVEKMTAWFLE